MADISVLDMTPIGHYADRSPVYRFSTTYPSRGVHVVGKAHQTKEAAFAVGEAELKAYCDRSYGNMGCVLGVTEADGGFRGVIVTYHSNT